MSGGLTTFTVGSVEVSTDGGSSYRAIPGVASVSKSGGDGTTTEVRAMSGVSQTAAPPTPATYTVTLSSLIPNHPSIALLNAEAESGGLILARFNTVGEQLRPANASAAVDGVTILTTGVATLAGTGAQADLTDRLYNEGTVIQTTTGGNNAALVNYTIDKINKAQEAVVYPAPGTAVSTALAYSLRRPGLRETASCRIVNIGTWEAGEGAALTGSITLAAEGRALFAISS